MKSTEDPSPSAHVLKKSQPEEFDLVILGGGTGSTIAAWTFAGEGKHVAVVERKYVGGSCPNIACLPSKNIIHSAKVASYFRRSKEFGITRRLRDRHGGRARAQAQHGAWPERYVYGKLPEHGSRVHIGNGAVPGSENSRSHPGRWDHTSTAG